MAKPLTFTLVVAMQIVPPLGTGKVLKAIHLHWFSCMAMQNLKKVAPGGGPCHVQHTLNESLHLHLQSSSMSLGVMLLTLAKTLRDCLRGPAECAGVTWAWQGICGLMRGC